MSALQIEVDELADRNWELREAEERARGLIEAQGDLIVRRDSAGRITYVNDAFCTLAGKGRPSLIGQPLGLPVREQGEVTVLADGTRVHDQKIDGDSGARWIAWREVAVRTDDGNEVQAVGRDVTDARRGRARARMPRATRPKPPIAPSRASSPWSATRSARRSTACSAWPICCSTRR